jgi:flagellar biosynthesis protein FlhA
VNWNTIKNINVSVPIFLLAVLAMVMLPLPAWILDSLFTFNIVLSILVLLVAVSAKRPLDFSVFPTVLLVATLLRLTLNVASTRMVLLHGHEGGDAVGKVIQAFGEVVIGGNYVVGMVVFIILMIINFVVITKGGERISEVTARFTLDALPGKQMAIDADLNAGIIDQEQAKTRRADVSHEADFYGAMDGASKFVRGDAVAGLMILFINLLGGLAIGVFQNDLSVADAFQRFALLTIGDGLVAQIPSLLLATAAAIIVTRINNDDGELSGQIGRQLLSTPSVIYTSAIVMLILGLIPGMPTLVFLVFAAVLAFVGWKQKNHLRDDAPIQQAEKMVESLTKKDEPLKWSDLPTIDCLSIELGYQLVSLVDQEQDGELLNRIRGIRKTNSEKMGFLIPEVRIKDNLTLKPSEYRIKLNGAKVAEASVKHDQLLAIKSGETFGTLDGEITRDPAYNMEAVWITPGMKSKALNLGYSVVDCPTVIATHMSKIIRENLAEIFGYNENEALMERLKSLSPKLTDNIEKALTNNDQLKVFRQLLREQVPLIDITNIATTIIDSAETTKDPILLSSDIRCTLKRSLITLAIGDRTKLNTFTLADELEKTLLTALNQSQQEAKTAIDSFPIDPNLLSQLQQRMPVVKEKLQQNGYPATLLVTPQLRPLLARYARSFARGLSVLSYNEIPEHIQVDVVGTLG